MSNRYYEPYSTELAADYKVPVETVDDSIDSALTEAALEDGWNGIPDLSDKVWNRIGSDVENRVIAAAREVTEELVIA
ncbi:hypothetical protein HOT42_gp04 [Microbacterium phage Metamorphoo]|uniref:Uncharacterized protein n=1 Tax=Microbacterium phage Metamorphoo TaxID=2201437 RepID=A0A2Z4Q606_9CAUD|nr:hypothetical protein HOT42_gp04 [Microbacterium phage Metamorphoo]AWY05355.1 hypothetical protein SEA_METAMORPHOO_4 [Microbacterium phage Metamorphoo]